MEARDWRCLGVVVVFVVGVRVILCFSVAIVCFVVDVHAGYPRRDAVDSLYNVLRVFSLLIQFLLFLIIERTRSVVLDQLTAVVTGDVLVDL